MDATTFASCVQEIRTQLYRTAYGYLGNEQDSLDAVGEAVYQGYRARKDLREPSYFTTWMTRILIHICYKELKRRSKQSMEEISEIKAEDFDHLSLQEAMERLPEQLRQVIILRYFTGLTLSETAEALQIPQGTVVTRQRRALALLRVELEEVDV